MIHSVRFTCVLDTNVIYPVNIRDLLLWFAHYDLFTVKWSNDICEEWIKVMRAKGVDEQTIAKRVQRMSDAFPDALVENYDGLIDSLGASRQGRPPCAGRCHQGQCELDRHQQPERFPSRRAGQVWP